MTTTLTSEQQKFFRTNGYLLGLPQIYSAEEMREHRSSLEILAELLEPSESYKDIREWHETSSWLLDIAMNPKILDLVEGIVGPDFYLWGSSFFVKPPHTSETVGWHQDAYYWPMAPHNTVTVWLAFGDVDIDNGTLRLVPGSHTAGVMRHERHDPSETDSVITLELEHGSFRAEDAVSMCLRAGQVSLHDDRAVHGSPANSSDRERAGLTLRYSGTNVRNDLAVNPHFTTYLARGGRHTSPQPRRRDADAALRSALVQGREHRRSRNEVSCRPRLIVPGRAGGGRRQRWALHRGLPGELANRHLAGAWQGRA